MSILDTFYILFESNADKVKKGADDARKSTKDLDGQLGRTDQQVQAAGQKIVNTFKDIGKAVVAAFAVKKVYDFTAANAELNVQLGITAQRANIAIGTLDALGNAAQRNGGTVDGLQGSIVALTQDLADLSTLGTSASLPWFFKAGVKPFDESGKIKPTLELYKELADVFQKMSPQMRQSFGAGFRMDQGTILLLSQGRRALEDIIAREEKLGTVTDADRQAALRYHEVLSDLWVTLKHGATILATALLPTLETTLSGFGNVISFVSEHKDFIQDLFIGAATAALYVYAPAILTATAVTAGFVAAWLVAAAPFVAVGAAIAAAALAYDDFVGFMDGKKSIIGELVQAWSGLGDVIENIARAVDATIAAAKVGASILSGGLYQAPKGAWDTLEGKSSPRADAVAKRVAEAQHAPASPATSSAAAQPQAQADIQTLQGLGWTKEQATGIVANVLRESGGKADATGDGGKAYGLAQWHPDRQAEFAKVFGHPIQQGTRAEQVKFIDYELRKGNEKSAGAKLAQATTSESAARIVSQFYERPAAAKEADTRAGIAAKLIATAPVLREAVAPVRKAAVEPTGLPVPDPKTVGAMTLGKEQIHAADTTPLVAHTSNQQTTTRNVTVEISGPISINAPQAKNAEDISREINGALQKEMRQSIAHFDDGAAA